MSDKKTVIKMKKPRYLNEYPFADILISFHNFYLKHTGHELDENVVEDFMNYYFDKNYKA